MIDLRVYGGTTKNPAPMSIFVQGQHLTGRESLRLDDAYLPALLRRAGYKPCAMVFVEHNGGYDGVYHYQPLLMGDGPPRQGQTRLFPGAAETDQPFITGTTANTNFRSGLPFELGDPPPRGCAMLCFDAVRRLSDEAARIGGSHQGRGKAWLRAASPFGGPTVYPFVGRRYSECPTGEAKRVWNLKPLSLGLDVADTISVLFGPDNVCGIGSFASPPRRGADASFAPGSVPEALAVLFGMQSPEEALTEFVRSISPIDCYSLPELRMRYRDAGYRGGTFPHCDPGVINSMVTDWTFSPALLYVALRSTRSTAVVVLGARNEIRVLVSPDVKPLARIKAVKRVCVVYKLDRSSTGVTECALIGRDTGAQGFAFVADPFSVEPDNKKQEVLLEAVALTLRQAHCVRDTTARDERVEIPVRSLPGLDAMRRGEMAEAEEDVKDALADLQRLAPRSYELLDRRSRDVDSFISCSTLYECKNNEEAYLPRYWRTNGNTHTGGDAGIVAHILADTLRISKNKKADRPPVGWVAYSTTPGNEYGACVYLSGTNAVFGGHSSALDQRERFTEAARSVQPAEGDIPTKTKLDGTHAYVPFGALRPLTPWPMPAHPIPSDHEFLPAPRGQSPPGAAQPQPEPAWNNAPPPTAWRRVVAALYQNSAPAPEDLQELGVRELFDHVRAHLDADDRPNAIFDLQNTGTIEAMREELVRLAAYYDGEADAAADEHAALVALLSDADRVESKRDTERITHAAHDLGVGKLLEELLSKQGAVRLGIAGVPASERYRIALTQFGQMLETRPLAELRAEDAQLRQTVAGRRRPRSDPDEEEARSTRRRTALRRHPADIVSD